MGAFYDTILKPALEAVGLPASRPATATAPAIHGVRLHDLRHTFAVLQLSAGIHFMQVSVVGAQYFHADARYLRRLHSRAGRRGRKHPARATSPRPPRRGDGQRRAAATASLNGRYVRGAGGDDHGGANRLSRPAHRGLLRCRRRISASESVAPLAGGSGNT